MFASRCIIWPLCSKFTSTLTANLFEIQFEFFFGVAMIFHPTQKQDFVLEKSQKDNKTAKTFIFQQVALQCDLKPFANKICLVQTVPHEWIANIQLSSGWMGELDRRGGAEFFMNFSLKVHENFNKTSRT